MANYKPVQCNGVFIAVMLSEQIVPGTFAFALNHLVDNELDLSALDARFNNDITGASAFDPRVMLKIVLLGYSRGLISSRRIALACEQDVQFMAISGDSRPSFSHIAKFVRNLQDVIQPVFKQVLLICDAQGLIGKEMFAIDGVKFAVFADIRYNKQLNRFTLRGKAKVNAQWHLYCLVHNIEKIATVGPQVRLQ